MTNAPSLTAQHAAPAAAAASMLTFRLAPEQVQPRAGNGQCIGAMRPMA